MRPQFHRPFVRLRRPLLAVLIGLALPVGAAFPQDEDPPENPIQSLFRLFGGESEEEPEATDDLVDRHAPIAARDLTKSFEQLQKLESEKKWPELIEGLQFLIDQPEDSAVRSRGVWRSFQRLAELQLRSLPPDARRVYLDAYEKLAGDLLREARRTHDFDQLAEVARRFWNTPAGQEAADDIASLLADSGDFVGAAIWMMQLHDDQVAITQTAEWKARAVEVWRRLGRADETQRLFGIASTPLPAPAPVATTATTMLFGGPTRSATTVADRPLLLEEWSSPLTQQPAVADQVRELEIDLVDEEHPTFPAMHGVAVNGRFAARTMNGVEVRDVASGRLQWRTQDDFSADRILGASLVNPATGATMGQFPLWEDPDLHPLASLLHRDGVLGQITSDGSRLFAIEQRLPLLSEEYDFYNENTPEGAAALHADHSVNALTAYDLETGRRLWMIGGPRSEETFAPVLSGVYFFGPPTPSGQELFVIGAAEDTINLYCLEASTGQPRWSQMIAQYDGIHLNEDLVRQMWACSPTVTRGVVYCPTNSGWLTAVDRLRHRLLWLHRYTDSTRSENYQPHYALESLNSRWQPSAPLLAGGELVFAPPELPDEMSSMQAEVECVDALTGNRRWRRPKDEAISIGGVFGDHVILIGPKQLAGWSLNRRGLNAWPARGFPRDWTPCGQGVAANGIYWIPFYEGAIVGFRLDDGTIASEQYNPQLRGRLGNLTLHGDRVISVGPQEIVGCWQQKPLEAEIARKIDQNPRDPAGRLLAARDRFANQAWDAALAELAQVDLAAPDLTDDQKTQHDRLTWECLVEVVRAEPAARDAEWQRLQSLATTAARNDMVEREGMARAIARSEWSTAIDRCWQRIEAPPSENVVSGPTSTSSDAWLSARIEDLWGRVPADVRQTLDQRIAERVATALAGPPQDAARTELLFAFHPRGRRLSLDLALRDREEKRLGAAEIRFRSLIPDLALGARALRNLIELAEAAGSPRDARAFAERLAARESEPATDSGETAADWSQRWVQDHPPAPPTHESWGAGTVELVRSGMDFGPGNGTSLTLSGRPSQWVRDRRWMVENSWDGLASIRSRDGVREWMTPLPDSPGYAGEPMSVAEAEGSILLLWHRGMLHALSPVDRQTLWNRPMPPRFARPIEYAWTAEHVRSEPASTTSDLADKWRQQSSFRREGPEMAISGRTAIILGQREMLAFDLLTGEERWRRTGFDASGDLVVDGEAVCVSRLGEGGNPLALRVSDGQELPPGELARNFAKAIGISGHRLLIADAPFRLFQKTVNVSLTEPRSGNRLWTQTFPAETKFGLGSGPELIAVDPEGRITALHLETGARNDVGTLPPRSLRDSTQVFTMADEERVFVATNFLGAENYAYLSLPSARVSGEVYAFHRDTKSSWRHSGRGLNLVISQFERLPVVILAAYSTEEKRVAADEHVFIQMIELLVLDKDSGRELVSWSGATTGGSPSFLNFDPRQRWIDLLSYNERMRLKYSPPPTADGRK